ncbi:MAG TPA: hypothetical protein QGH10_16805 [Armatimonadota bacterium]|nr:hypothetical protein [Armatimonadota bacterium]
MIWVMVGFMACVGRAGWASRACVLRDDVPGLDLERVDALSEALTTAGHVVTPLLHDELVAEGVLTPEHFDALILTDSPRFPVSARDAVVGYLRAGGDLVLLGGYAFETPLVKYGGRWAEVSELSGLVLNEAEAVQSLFTFDGGDLLGWTRGSDHMDHPTEASAVEGRSGQAMRIDIRNAEWYDVYWTALPEPVADGHDAVCLWAKGDLKTPQLFIEVVEQDGSRWSCAADIGTEWRATLLHESTFLFKQDGSPESRGGEGDGLDLSAGVRLTVGLARDRVPSTKGDHVLWLDEIGTLALGAGVDLRPSAPELPVFSRYEPYELRDAVRAVASDGQDLLTGDLLVEGEFGGPWALGFALPNQQRFIPLLTAQDTHGRDRGWAAGMLVNYAGQYAGSSWLLCGVTTPEFYTSDGFGEALAGALTQMNTRDLAGEAQAESERLDGHEIALESPAPGFVTKSDDGKHFVDGDGKRIFLTGCNYIGSMGRRFFGGPWLHYLEDDFRKAREAGINAMRVYGPGKLVTDPEKRDALCELARRYGIYLLITAVDHTTLLTDEELAARVRAVAEAFKDEPMVIGYDLQNEPYPYKVAEIEVGGQKLGERYPEWKQWPEYMKWAGLEIKNGNDFSSFPNVDGPLPVNDEWRAAFDATNGIYGEWIGLQVDAIREVDQRHFITVGYNTINECLPANEQLDYVTHHTYCVPYSADDVIQNLTVLDRIQSIFPDRPICLGEFGYSNGDPLDDGYIDLHTSAVGEMLHYLYAYAGGFEGAHKWELNDNPLWISLAQTVWIPKEAVDKHIHQGRFGMHYYDGTISGRQKPICHALRFFRNHVDSGAEPGELKVEPGSTRIGVAYEYRSDGALIVGGVEHDSPELSFSSANAACVMLRWTDDELKVMSSADADVEMDPARYLPGWEHVAGTQGGMQVGRLRVQLLEGETITISR